MRVFIIIVIILLLLRWLLKPLIKFTIKTTLNKMADEVNRRQQQQGPLKKEGTISINHIPEKGKRSKGSTSTDHGDYVDFEEIK